jgi:hypothetical protein
MPGRARHDEKDGTVATTASNVSCDIDHLARLDAAATPGPWYVRARDDSLCCSAAGVATKPNTSDDNDDLSDSTLHGIVAATYLQDRNYVMPADDRGWEDAALIAAMRSALPELLRLARIGAAAERA